MTVSTGGYLPPPPPPGRYDGHDECTCGHWRESHSNRIDTCYDPERECGCVAFIKRVPWRVK